MSQDEKIYYNGKVYAQSPQSSYSNMVAVEWVKPGDTVVEVYGRSGTRNFVKVAKVWKNGVVVLEDGNQYSAPEVMEDWKIKKETGKSVWTFRLGYVKEVRGNIRGHGESRYSHYIRLPHEGETPESIAEEKAEAKAKANAEAAEKARKWQAKLDANWEAFKPYWEKRQEVQTAIGTMYIVEHPNKDPNAGTVVTTIIAWQYEDRWHSIDASRPKTQTKIDISYRHLSGYNRDDEYKFNTGRADTTAETLEGCLKGYAEHMDMVKVAENVAKAEAAAKFTLELI